MSEETKNDQPQEDTVNDEMDQAQETAQSDYPVDIEDVGTLRKKLTVTVPRKQIDAKFDEMFGELRQTAQIPGFRVGHAPRRLIEKRFGKEVGQDVRNALIGESLGQATENSGLNTLGEPELDLDKIELPDAGDLQYSFEVEIMPEFDLPELKGIKVNKSPIEITDERLDEAVDQYRQSQVKYEPTDGAAQEGDTLTAAARITGEGIEPLERPGLSLRVAPGQVEGIPLVDLAKDLTGKQAGQIATINVTVPDSHPNEDWRGKELSIEITVSQVSRRILPEAQQVAETMGFESVAEFREHLQRYLQARTDVEAQREMRDQVRQYLLDSTTFDLPDGILRTYATRALRKRYVELMNMGIPREKIDENITRLQADVGEQSKRDLKLLLVMNKIAEQEGITVSDEEINAGIAQMAQQYNRRPERLRQELERDGALSAVSDSIRDDKILDMLLKNAEVTEVAKEEEPAKQADEKPKKAAGKTAKKASKKSAAEKASKKVTKKSAAKDSGKKVAKKSAAKKAGKKASKKSDA